MNRNEKRKSERKAQKDKVKFLRVTELGDVCIYIPENRPEVAVIELVGEFPKTKDREPIVVDRKQLLKFFVLEGDVKRAKKEYFKNDGYQKLTFWKWVKKLFHG